MLARVRFLAEGNLTLANISPAVGHPSRLHAQLSGHFTSAAFDESPTGAFVVRGVVVGVAVIGLGGIVWWALFARSARPPALQHAKRKELFEIIRADPGLSWSGLQRQLGWPTGTLLFHLGRLEEAGIVVGQPYRNTVRYFENHGRYATSWHELAPLRDPDASRLHAWLLLNPGLDQTRIAQAAQAWGWPRARTLRRLQRLQEGNLLAKQVNGRRVLYTARRPQADNGQMNSNVA
jgi:hypothetical protein